MPLPSQPRKKVSKQCIYCKKWVNRSSLSKHVKTKRCLATRSEVPVVHEGAAAGSNVPENTVVRRQRGGADKSGDGDGEPVPRERRGENFMLFFPFRCKYKVSQRLLSPRMEFTSETITRLGISDETGGGYLPNVHSHAYVQTKEKYNFEEFKNLWVIELQCPGFTDIQSPKKIKDWVKYLSKEDYKTIAVGVDRDWLSVVCKSYCCAQKWNKLMPNLSPYCYLSYIDKKIFDVQFAEFRKEFEEDKLIFDMTYAILYDWQIEVLKLLDEQDDRKVLWIYDAVGGEGKTFLAKYIQLYRDCICLESGKKTDLANCFSNQKYVLFDYTRSMEETINYSIIENFKNGFLFSGKYDSSVKKFAPCKWSRIEVSSSVSALTSYLELHTSNS
ncbi:Hypothetical predicted protein [Mytilus galloprovincialis]|uniref:Uncharacterized protein n=1 Tax=Mytilus galloprovincialis TaxID=29158 RepID=A0A8B6BIR5_MYTGA|nr:Hypothetical predicted protein [Mytilus galloprovincialis]